MIMRLFELVVFPEGKEIVMLGPVIWNNSSLLPLASNTTYTIPDTTELRRGTCLHLFTVVTFSPSRYYHTAASLSKSSESL